MAIYPSDTASNIESADDLAKVRQYLRKLNDDLTYMFNNLTPEDNYSASAPKLIYSVDENGEASFEISSSGIRMRVASDEYVKSNVEILDNKISLKVSLGDVVNQVNSELLITGNSIALTTGHFTVNSTNLTVDSAGNATFSGALSAASGTFTGTVSAGTITGSTIIGGTISIGGTTQNPVFAVDANGNLTAALKGGSITIGGTAANPVFAVDSNGNLTANAGTFGGALIGGTISIGGTALNPAFAVDQYGNLTANAGSFKGNLDGASIDGQSGLHAGSRFYVEYWSDDDDDYDIGCGGFGFYEDSVYDDCFSNAPYSTSTMFLVEANTGNIHCRDIYPWTSDSGRWQHGLAWWVEWLYDQVTGGGGGGGDDPDPGGGDGPVDPEIDGPVLEG